MRGAVDFDTPQRNIFDLFIGNHSPERDHSNVEQLGKQMKKTCFGFMDFHCYPAQKSKIGDVDRINTYQI